MVDPDSVLSMGQKGLNILLMQNWNMEMELLWHLTEQFWHLTATQAWYVVKQTSQQLTNNYKCKLLTVLWHELFQSNTNFLTALFVSYMGS